MTSPRVAWVNEMLGRSPTAQKIALEIESETVKLEDAERRGHGEAIARAERERSAKLPPLIAAHEKAVAVRKSAEEKLVAAQGVERDALRARISFTTATDNEIAKHQHALAASADPRIAETRQKIQRHQAALQREGHTTQTERRWVGLTEREVAVASNADAVSRRISACVEAMRACDELAATYLPPADVPSALERIVDMVGGFVLHTPTEPFAGSKSVASAA